MDWKIGSEEDSKNSGSSTLPQLMLNLKRPFKIGDRVIIAGITGDVMDIRLTHVILNQVGGTVSSEERFGIAFRHRCTESGLIMFSQIWDALVNFKYASVVSMVLVVIGTVIVYFRYNAC